MNERTEPWNCKVCGYRIDAVGHEGGKDVSPKDGDLTICLNCGALYQYVNGVPALMSDSEIDALPGDVKTELIKLELLRSRLVGRDLKTIQ